MDPEQLKKDERLEAARKRFAERQKKLHNTSSELVLQPTDAPRPASFVASKEPPKQLTAEDLFGPSDSDNFYQASFSPVSTFPGASPHAVAEVRPEFISAVSPELKQSVPEPVPVPEQVPVSETIPLNIASGETISTQPPQSAPDLSAEQELMDELHGTESPYSYDKVTSAADEKTVATMPSITDSDNITKPRDMLRPEHIFDFSLGSMQEIPLDDNVDLNDEVLEELVFPATLLSPADHASLIVDAPNVGQPNQVKPFWEAETDDSYWNLPNHIVTDNIATNVEQKNSPQELNLLEHVDSQEFSPHQNTEAAATEETLHIEEDAVLSDTKNNVPGEENPESDVEIPNDSIAMNDGETDVIPLRFDNREAILPTQREDELITLAVVEKSSFNESLEKEVVDVSELQKEITELKISIQDQETLLNQQKNSIEELNATIKNHVNKINELKTTIEKQKSFSHEQSASIDELKTSLDQQQRLIDEQKAAIEQQRATLEVQTATIKEQKEALDKQIALTEKQCTSIDELNATVEELKAKIAERDIVIERSKTSELASSQDHNSIIEQQKSTIERMKKENTNLKLGRMDLNDRIAELEEELDELKSTTISNVEERGSTIPVKEMLAQPVKSELMGMQAYDPFAVPAAVQKSASTPPVTEATPESKSSLVESAPVESNPVDSSPTEITPVEFSSLKESGKSTFESLFGSSEQKSSDLYEKDNSTVSPEPIKDNDKGSNPGADIYGVTDSVSVLQLHSSPLKVAADADVVSPNVEVFSPTKAEVVPSIKAEEKDTEVVTPVIESMTDESPSPSADAIDPLDEFESMLQSVVQSQEKSQTAPEPSSTQLEKVLVAESKNLYALRPELSRFDTGADFRERLMVWKGWQVDMTNWFPASNPKVAL